MTTSIADLRKSYGALVVTDPCLPHPVWKPGAHFVEENIRQIPNVIDWLFKTPDGRAKAE